MAKEPYDSYLGLNRQGLVEKAMRIYKIHGETYRGLVDKYCDLLAQKRILGIRPLNAIPKSQLREFPVVEFLDAADENEARMMLDPLPLVEIYRIIAVSGLAVDSYIYNTLVNRVREFDYEVRNHGKRNFAGVDPNYRHQA